MCILQRFVAYLAVMECITEKKLDGNKTCLTFGNSAGRNIKPV